MSVLAPLYFLGALAIGLPIFFHLIRRTPRGQVEFSSLMFLEETPPTLTRRSRLDNWLLLFIRALALILLAIAFTRPFWRGASMSDSDAVVRRSVLMIDTSASMRRGALWDQTKSEAEEVIEDLSAGDQLAIVAFDNQPKTVLSFDQASQLPLEQLKTAAKTAVDDLKPTWMPTDLGSALAYAADLAATYEDADSAGKEQIASSSGPANLILLSDMQEGARTESLQTFAWPDDLQLDVRQMKSEQRSNASARILQTVSTASDEDDETGKDRVRVRVENSEDAVKSQFRLSWITNTGQSIAELPIMVPPGQSRVVRMPEPDTNTRALMLLDDDHMFDNQRFVIRPEPKLQTLLFLGADSQAADSQAEQRESLMYYLRKVPLDNSRRIVETKAIEPSKLLRTPEPYQTPLVVVAETIEAEIADRLMSYVKAGGQVLFALAKESDKSMAPAIERTTESSLKVTEASVDDYAMLAKIDFTHPVFGSMSDPQFNDFTKIHFWSHRKLEALDEDWKVLAQFDDGDPALIEKRLGEGKVWVLAAGWQPSASQLALSTKFIPLVFTFFDATAANPRPTADFVLGKPIELSLSEDSIISGTDGFRIAASSPMDLDAITEPGIYRHTFGNQSQSFAINMAPSESQTTPMAVDSLERFGVDLGQALSVAEIKASQRQLRDIELEGRQKLWQWLIVIALVLLGLETLLGGLLGRTRRAAQTAAA